MKKCVIICGGEIDDYNRVKSEICGCDKIICADYGYVHAVKMGLRPDVVVGDFDSVDKNAVECNCIAEVPAKKDFTDTQLALQYAKKLGCDKVLLIGALGGRVDHSIVNITLLKKLNCENMSGYIYDGKSYIYMADLAIELCGSKGDLLTIIPQSEILKNITTENLEYPLCGEDMEYGSTRGISNVFTDDRISVKWESGTAIIVHTPQK